MDVGVYWPRTPPQKEKIITPKVDFSALVGYTFTGEYRKPKDGEWYVNANSLNPKYHPNGIKPFPMKMENGIGMDPEIKTHDRWILKRL